MTIKTPEDWLNHDKDKDKEVMICFQDGKSTHCCTATERDEGHLVNAIGEAAKRAHANSRAHGFWDAPAAAQDPISWKLSRIALMHSELSECLEGVRKDLMDDHLPERSMEVAELADTVVRILDYCGAYGLPLGEVIVEKMRYNASRPFRHGDKLA